MFPLSACLERPWADLELPLARFDDPGRFGKQSFKLNCSVPAPARVATHIELRGSFQTTSHPHQIELALQRWWRTRLPKHSMPSVNTAVVSARGHLVQNRLHRLHNDFTVHSHRHSCTSDSGSLRPPQPRPGMMRAVGTGTSAAGQEGQEGPPKATSCGMRFEV